MVFKLPEFKRIKNILYSAVVLLLPTQLGYHIWYNQSLIYGIRVDYLAATVFLTDIIIFLLFILEYKKLWFLMKNNLVILLSLVFIAAFNIVFSYSLFPAILKWLKVFELLALALLISKSKFLTVHKVTSLLAVSVMYTGCIALAQFIKGHSVGGPFYLLGERGVSIFLPSIAKVNLFSRTFLRAYSTFSHPNSLAGFLSVVILFLVFQLNNNKEKWLNYSALLLGGAALVLTFSKSAIAALVICTALLIIYKRSKESFFTVGKLMLFSLVILSLVLPPLSNVLLKSNFQITQNIYERLVLADVSGKILSMKTWGIGLNNFVKMLPNILDYPTITWNLQPVHNIYLLLINEVGLLPFVVLALVFYRHLSSVQRNGNYQIFIVFLFIAVSGFMDHYWLTLQQNQLLLSVVFGISLKKF